MHSILQSVNSDSFATSFPIWIPFISISSMIAVGRTSKTMLNESGESGYSCPVPDLICSPLSMILAVGLSYMVFIMLRYVPSIPSFLRVLS